MKMELQILDWIQQMRTPVGDVWMVFISRLGNAGMIWILFTCLLLMIPRTRRWGAALAAALCLDAKAYGLPDPSVRCESDSSADHCPPGGLFLPVGTYGSFVCCGRGSVLCRGEKMVENHAASGDPDGVFKNVFICALPDRCFGRHDCGMRGGVFWKPAGGASDTVLETEDEKTRGQKK